MLQSMIERMSAVSGQMKVASTGIVTAVASLSATVSNPSVALVGVPVVLLLSLLDSYYLALERGFRAKFDEVRIQEISGFSDFNCSTDRMLSLGKALCSRSVWPFYLGLIALSVATFAFVGSSPVPQ